MGNDDSAQLRDLLVLDQAELLRQWVGEASKPMQGRLTEAELRATLSDLLALLTSAVGGGIDVAGPDYANVRALLTEMSREWVRRGFSPSETASAVFTLKEPLFAAADRRGASLDAVIGISRWVDGLGLFTFESFARARESVITEQSEQLLELTTPVVKLWDGVLAVPLVGTLDSARTQIVMEKLLQALVDTGSEHAIIDITGVPAVDTEVAQHLLKTVVAARLMGADCTISGIRPQIAQTIVALGIEFGDIPTKATLADALLHALRGSGVDVVRQQRRRTI
ncbi:MAG TPA: STAS domain-containing protein [Pseudonocardia sp.]|nr:STAS domain-containing protein [Pseudonocardia sp.]